MMDSLPQRQAPNVIPAHEPDVPPPRAPVHPSSFREVFDEQFDYVWTALRRLGVPDRDRQDQAHEVFLRVSQHLGNYDLARPIRPWLFAFAARVASEYRRLSCHRHEVLGEELPAATVREGPEEDAERNRKRRLVIAALEHLDMDKRAVLILHDLDGSSVPDIAEALGIPEGTAYSRLRAARAQFTDAVRRLQPQGRGAP